LPSSWVFSSSVQPFRRRPASAARVVCGSQPVPAISSSRMAPVSRPSGATTSARVVPWRGGDRSGETQLAVRFRAGRLDLRRPDRHRLLARRCHATDVALPDEPPDGAAQAHVGCRVVVDCEHRRSAALIRQHGVLAASPDLQVFGQLRGRKSQAGVDPFALARLHQGSQLVAPSGSIEPSVEQTWRCGEHCFGGAPECRGDAGNHLQRRVGAGRLAATATQRAQDGCQLGGGRVGRGGFLGLGGSRARPLLPRAPAAGTARSRLETPNLLSTGRVPPVLDPGGLANRSRPGAPEDGRSRLGRRAEGGRSISSHLRVAK
jgi:hypothetical protein